MNCSNVRQRAESEGWSIEDTKLYLDSARQYEDILQDGGFIFIQKPDGKYGLWVLQNGVLVETDDSINNRRKN